MNFLFSGVQKAFAVMGEGEGALPKDVVYHVCVCVHKLQILNFWICIVYVCLIEYAFF